MSRVITSSSSYIVIIPLPTQQSRNKQIKYYYINIRLFVHFATCFDSTGPSSGKYSWNVHSYWIVLLIWIHISGHEYAFQYDSSFFENLNLNKVYIYDRKHGSKLAIQYNTIQYNTSVHFMNICLVMIKLGRNM
jgi:hypothetical protein